MEVCLCSVWGARARDRAPQAPLPAVTDEQTSRWVEEHPDLILKAINAYMARQQPDLTEFIASADVPIDGRYPHIGAEAGRAELYIVEFSDFNCHYCKEAEQPVHSRLEAHKDVRVVYRDLGFLHPSSESAALAAKAAGRQGKCQDCRAALFAGQKQTGFTDEDFRAFAEAVGLNVAAWETDRNSESVRSELKSDMELIGKLKIGGTPFFFGWVPAKKYGLIAQGAVTSESFEGIIQELRSGKTWRPWKCFMYSRSFCKLLDVKANELHENH